MPEPAHPKQKEHPWATSSRKPGRCSAPSPSTAAPVVRPPRRAASSHAYAELHATSNFTFLTGASHPEELVEQAAALGHAAIAITDRNSLAGIVRGHVAAGEVGIQFIVGCRLALAADHHGHTAELSVLVYPTDVQSYARLCRLLTLGKRRAPKGACHLSLRDLIEHQDGLLAVVIPPRILDQPFLTIMEELRRVFEDDRLSLAATSLYGQNDRARQMQLAALAEHVCVPLAATNDVHYHIPARRPLQDVLTCIRHGCTIEQAGLRLFPNAERCLKPPEAMARLFADHQEAVARTIEIAERASGFNLDQLRYQYPHEVYPTGVTPIHHLTDLTWHGAAERYPSGVPDKVRDRIRHELRLIDDLNYAPYFLTVHDLVRFARSRGILCQGRGAAANSAVCYCLGVTAVDPDRIDLLFERFISRERNEPPDIDIDFEHERREEVIQYIYTKYGRDRAAIAAEVITYRIRSAIRDVGKALGLSLDCIDRLARNSDGWSDPATRADRLRGLGLAPDSSLMKMMAERSQEILGFPRHLSQHVGGFIITRGPLHEMVPVENAAMPDRTVIEWDKDDIDAMDMLKVDVLGLGMLTCIRKSFELIERHHHRALTLDAVPAEDLEVYDMISKADTVGVFQIESRAQMTMLPRLKPRCYYDLVIEVAIVRPGPIQGDMIHPYMRRRNGDEPVDYPSNEVKRVLSKTLGVPLFQEQAMSLAIVAAGFTADEADQLRRAMAAWKRKADQLLNFENRFIGGMLQRGYDREFAERCFHQLKGFSEYGFPESHAASFALLVYVSAWLKKHYPAAFAAALLNSQPMGFYAPAQLVRDAQDHGVEVRPVDVNHSRWDCTLESSNATPALRLGMRLVKAMRKDDANRIVEAVTRNGPFRSIDALKQATGVTVNVLRCLAAGDAFGSMGLDRQSARWHIRALRDDPPPLFRDVPAPTHPETDLPRITPSRQVIHDYLSLGLSLKAHPVAFLRAELGQRHVTCAVELIDEQQWPHGRKVAVAGLVLARQQPATASGTLFMTLEDETGIANLIVRPHICERCRQAVRHGVVVLAHGVVERQGEVVHILAGSLTSLDDPFNTPAFALRDFR